MAQRSSIREELYRKAMQWDSQAKLNGQGPVSYSALMDELLFHADLRYRDYIQYQNREGEFPSRLSAWLSNVSHDKDARTLLELASFMTFLDRKQMLALYRDAYRRVVEPYVSSSVADPVAMMLAQERDTTALERLRRYVLCSITQSFDSPDFLSANDLSGLSKPIVIGERCESMNAVRMNPKRKDGLILFEDFVGTGQQALTVVKTLAKKMPPNWRILFVPLIMLARGERRLRDELDPKLVSVEPVLVIGHEACLAEKVATGEPVEFRRFRALVRSTATRVLARLNRNDDPPTNAFGHKGSGAMIVTCHNTPNNTLPLLHHRAPNWAPLFRRIHHSKDGI